MIVPYSTPEMLELWSLQNKTQKWLDVEIAVCDELEHFRRIPEMQWRTEQPVRPHELKALRAARKAAEIAENETC